MDWQQISEFDPAEHGTDAMLLKVRWHPRSLSIAYGWYDPEQSPEYPWRVIDDHDSHGDRNEYIKPNGFPVGDEPEFFCPFSAIK